MKWMVALLVLVALAGCADDAAPEEAPDEVSFDDENVVVTEDTGAILGVVINDAIVPVEGAMVVVVGSETVTGGDPLSDTTDAQGRFTFGGLPGGTYFLEVTKDLHNPVQSSVEVVAGAKDPPVTKIQLNRLYSGAPYIDTVANDGFFTCSQAGTLVWGYTSSPCHAIGWGPGVDLCESAGACLDQERVFHADVGAGWQTLVFEMTWQPSAQGTSDWMGMSVSTFHPERNKNHWFASVSAPDPMYFTIQTGEMHPTAQEGDGPLGPVPEDGITDMSMYMSVRSPDPCTTVVYCPAFAIDQDFQTWMTAFYYQPAPEGWSVRNGDQSPF